MKLTLILSLMMTSLLTWAGPRVVGNGFLEDKDTSATEVEANSKTSKMDRIDYPFVFDSRIGNTHWCSIDLVSKMDAFKPDQKAWKDNLYLHRINFLPMGTICWDFEYKEKVCRPGEKLEYLKWTKIGYEQDGIVFDGVIMHKGDSTASGYLLKNIQGRQFMFLQHKSDDYISRGQMPSYYVFQPCLISEKK